VSFDIRQDILDSIADIEELLSSYDVLFMCVNQRTPDKIELAALGSVLQSFYNGVEGVFLLIAKQVDGNVPIDPAWHQALQNQMTEANAKRVAVLSSETADRLSMYMKFRHFFRHAYSFQLSWPRMEQLVQDLMPVWSAVKEEILKFTDVE
jgi:hypothetical protein